MQKTYLNLTLGQNRRCKAIWKGTFIHIFIYTETVPWKFLKFILTIGKTGFIQQQKNTPLKHASVFDTIHEYS